MKKYVQPFAAFMLALSLMLGFWLYAGPTSNKAFIQSAYHTIETPVGHQTSEDTYLFKSEKLTISHLYPNPAVDYVDVDVQNTGNFTDVRIVFFNILGQQVEEISLDPFVRTQRINLRDLNPGMYPYQLVIDGRSLVTKKLYVR